MNRMMLILTGAIALGCLSMARMLSRGPTPIKIEYPEYFGNRIIIPANNPTTKEGVTLGRMLFYETALSANDEISCASCHRQQFAFSDPRPFSQGADGSFQSRNSMSLANLLWVRNFFWDGRVKGLEKQAEVPLTNPHEMGQSLGISAQKLKKKKFYSRLFQKAFGTEGITGDRIVKAIAQFERTLVSANSKYDKYLRGTYQPTASESNGLKLFFTNPDPGKKIRGAACGHCHGGPKTYIELFHNNGLDSLPPDAGRQLITGQAYDKGRFRVATLRNIALTSPYMHDSRFNTLEEVVSHYNEHIVETTHLSPFLQGISNTPGGKRLDLSPEEKKDIVAFLHMLTDSTFITDKRFSNPF